MTTKQTPKHKSDACGSPVAIELSRFLKAPENSVTRERIFFNKAYYELKVAAAKRGYALTIFEPEVDRDGFDVVFDDGDNERRFQMKTVLKSSKTQKWNINKRLLKPNIRYSELMGHSPADSGYGGGVILLEIDDSKDDLPISYFYTDLFAIWMLKESFLRKTTTTAKKYSNIFAELFEGIGSEKYGIGKTTFLPIKNPESLLAIAGFHNSADGETIYLPFDNILIEVYKHDRITIDNNGMPEKNSLWRSIKITHDATEQIISLLSGNKFTAFSLPSSKDGYPTETQQFVPHVQ